MRGGGPCRWPPAGGMMKLGTFVESPDVINHANFHFYLMNSLQASGGQKEVLPLKYIRLLQHCLALPRWQVILNLQRGLNNRLPTLIGTIIVGLNFSF